MAVTEKGAGKAPAAGASEAASAAGPAPIPASYGAFLLPVYIGSLVLLFIGERIVTSDTLRDAFSGLGAVGLVGTTIVRLARSRGGQTERHAAERVLALCSVGGAIAVAIYFATTTEMGRGLFGYANFKPEARARFDGATTVLWIAVLVLSVLPLIMGEIALAPMRRAAMIEARRVRTALQSGLVLACAAIYGTLFTYAAGELDYKADYSYFRTARPSESTKKVAASATEPIEVKAFFPELNEVGTEVSGYLKELGAAAPNLKIEEHDRLLVPTLAKEAKVTTDGVVVLSRGNSRDTLTIGAEMKTAANKLKTLDGDFQKALLKVLREAHVAYFTVGHGELNEAKGSEAAEGRTAKVLRKLFESQNYTIKDLGLVQGLGTDVPADATTLVVLGPTQAFLPEEVESIKRFLDRGGHALLALDPDAKIDDSPLAAIVGLTWNPTLLANDKVYVRRRFNNSDRTNLATNRFSSHAAVSTVSRNSGRMPVIFPGASSLDKAPDAPAGLKIDFIVKSLGDTFDDKNGDFEYQQGQEKRAAYNIAAAVSKPISPPPPGYKGKDAPELRAVVVADADVFSDAAFGNEPNVFFTVDIVRWLGGEESFSGAINNAEDVRIEHTKQKDTVWFYGTIIGAPALVLGVGLLVSRRPRRAAKPKAAAKKGTREEKGE